MEPSHASGVNVSGVRKAFGDVNALIEKLQRMLSRLLPETIDVQLALGRVQLGRELA